MPCHCETHVFSPTNQCMIYTFLLKMLTGNYEINQSRNSINSQVPSWWSAGQNFSKSLVYFYSRCVSLRSKPRGLLRDDASFLFPFPSAHYFRYIPSDNEAKWKKKYSKGSLLEFRPKISPPFYYLPQNSQLLKPTMCHLSPIHTRYRTLFFKKNLIFASHLSLGLDRRCLLCISLPGLANLLASMLRVSLELITAT
jgi:hypothetical protein